MNNANTRFLEELAKCLPKELQDEFLMLAKAAYDKYKIVCKMQRAKKIVEKLEAMIANED